MHKLLTTSDRNRPLVCYDLQQDKFITGILKYSTCSILSVDTEDGLKYFNPLRSEFLDCSYYIKSNQVIKLELTTRFLEVLEYLTELKINVILDGDNYDFLITDSIIGDAKLTDFIGVQYVHNGNNP